MFVVTTLVVTALLGIRQVTLPCPDPPVSKQVLKPLMVSVTASGRKRQQVVTTNLGNDSKSLLRT
ncbi:hypothetical protein [Laspinema palackyanum]|uniref:hypothetical protein n=1 Tax=Laspinema palackyanum TaxID=3231601 RepID=UPI00345CFF2E|nr:hypothetical protein [Laspinema sp. D2c]